jgi:hypothetical protein
MLTRGDAVPHFHVTSVDQREISYATIWQHRSLVLVALGDSESEAGRAYAESIMALAPRFAAHDAECIVTRDAVDGVAAPAVLVSDRWGEIVHLATAASVDRLPPPGDLLDWTHYVQLRCPECEGEAR